MSEFISLQTAVTMTTDYRADKEDILDSSYRGQGTLPICETFDKSDIETILGQSGCSKLRVYFALDANSKVRALLVGVNSNDEDMLPGESTDGYIVEEGSRCPPDCPPSSDLNS